MNYEMKVFPQKAEDGTTYWTAMFPAVEGCVGGGDTPEEAVAEAQENLEIFLDYLREEKKKVPDEYNPPEYSGKIALRIAKSTHKRVAERAEQEGISINTFLSNAIEYVLGIKKYEHMIDKKIDSLKAIAGTSYIIQMEMNSKVNELWAADYNIDYEQYVTVNMGGNDE